MFLRKIFSCSRGFVLKRKFYSHSIQYSCESNEKTTITILNKNFDYGLMIDNVSEYGFILNNGIKTIGPIIIFPKTMMSWNIASSLCMNNESLSLLLHIEPKLDIIIIGLDDDYSYNSLFLQNLRQLFKKYKIPVEVLPVHQACSTFNFLIAENRYVAAALIPPKVKCPEDMLLSNYNKKTLEEIERKSDPFFLPHLSS